MKDPNFRVTFQPSSYVRFFQGETRRNVEIKMSFIKSIENSVFSGNILAKACIQTKETICQVIYKRIVLIWGLVIYNGYRKKEKIGLIH